MSEQVKVTRDKCELQLNETKQQKTELERELIDVNKAKASDKTSM